MNNNSNALVTDYQKFIHTSKYSRFMWDEMRRESWSETVGRWEEFFANEVVAKVEDETNRKKLEKALKKAVNSISGLEVMPSMRTMMTAGNALIRNHLSAYNCSYVAINRPQAFDEILYILSCGTGVGFSVERQEIAQLPTVADEFHKSDIVIKVQDSKEGWAKSLKEFIALLYQGQIPSSDTSLVRKKGAPLVTFGGRASGPEPLEKLFSFCIKLFQGAAGRKLTSLECHDLVCRIADAIVSGGVRRCLDDRYHINTPEGWKPITKMSVGDMIKINGKKHKIINKFDNGIKDTVNIKLADGTTHTCTKEHRWFVFNNETRKTEWRSSEELTSGKFSMLKPIGM